MRIRVNSSGDSRRRWNWLKLLFWFLFNSHACFTATPLAARGASLLSGREAVLRGIPVSEILIYPELELTAECEAVRECRGGGRMGEAIRIGIIGDFEPAYHSHFATNAALYDAATKLKVPLELRWLPTPSLEGPDAKKLLARWDGLIASPGSPYKSFNGMLRGIEFARTRNWPFVGT